MLPTNNDDGTVFTAEGNIGTSLSTKAGDIRTLRSNDARECRTIREGKETNGGEGFSLFDGVRDGLLSLCQSLAVLLLHVGELLLRGLLSLLGFLQRVVLLLAASRQLLLRSFLRLLGLLQGFVRVRSLLLSLGELLLGSLAGFRLVSHTC